MAIHTNIDDALERQGRIDPTLAAIGRLEERVGALESRARVVDADAGRSARDDAIQAQPDLTRPEETALQRYDAARRAVSERLNSDLGPGSRVETALDALAQAAHDLGYEEGYSRGIAAGAAKGYDEGYGRAHEGAGGRTSSPEGVTR